MDASSPSAPPPQPPEPDFGVLLRRAFDLTRESALPLAKTWACVALPGLAVEALAYASTGIADRQDLRAAIDAERWAAVAAYVAASLTGRLAVALGTTAAFVAGNEVLEGRPCDPSAAWARVRRRLLPYMWTNVVYGVRVGVGYLLFIVPGIVLSIRWTLWSAAFWIEERSGSAALDRSRQIVVPRLVTVLCAAWGSGAIATAVGFFAGLAGVALTLAVGVPLHLVLGDSAADPLVMGLVLLIMIAESAVKSAASAWAWFVVALCFWELAPLHPEPPESGYFL